MIKYKYSIVLYKDNKRIGLYHPEEKLFERIKKDIEPYHTIGVTIKPIRCVETEEIFRCASEAAKILRFRNLTTSYNADQRIRIACKNKNKCYGFHWEFVK